jgi:hypothetical protein
LLQQDKYGRLCNRIFGISKAIAVVAVIMNDQQVVYKANESFHVPEEKDRVRHMLKQSFILVNEPSTNEDYFGKVKYVMVHHEMYDVYLFKISSDPSKLLSVVLKPREYNQNELVEAVTYELLTL